MAVPQPTPGPQQPEKYRPYNVGPKYTRFGEQPGWIYIPWKDAYELDPKAANAYGQSSGLIEPTPEPPKTPGLADTLLPIAATVGTISAANSFFPSLIGNRGTSTTEGTGLLGYLFPGGATQATKATGPLANPSVSGGLLSGGAAPAVAGAAALPAAAGVIPGSVSATAPYGALAGAGGEAVATAAPAVAAPAAEGGVAASGGLLGIGVLPLAATAAGTYLGGRAALNMLQGKKDSSLAGLIGRGTLGIATGGLSELARPFLMHESTRDVARKHTQQLLNQNKDDAVWQSYVSGMRQQYDSAPLDPSKPFAGKYGSWDEYKQAGLESADLTGVYGNLKTFGPDWAKLSFDQQKAVTQGLINAGLYDSSKGEVIITNEEQAKKIKDEVLKTQPPSQNPALNDQRTLPRSSTISPGVGRDGKPISIYNKGLLGAGR